MPALGDDARPHGSELFWGDPELARCHLNHSVGRLENVEHMIRNAASVLARSFASMSSISASELPVAALSLLVSFRFLDAMVASFRESA